MLVAVTETARRHKAVLEQLRAGHVLLEAGNRRLRHALDRPVRDEHIHHPAAPAPHLTDAIHNQPQAVRSCFGEPRSGLF